MKGENLTKAEEWFNRAIKKEEEKNDTMMEKCLDQAIKLEKKGIEAGESWD